MLNLWQFLGIWASFVAKFLFFLEEPLISFKNIEFNKNWLQDSIFRLVFFPTKTNDKNIVYKIAAWVTQSAVRLLSKQQIIR